ncbi:MAG TPA: hypothetical protein VNH42_05465 [Mariprofundaceae bacterium]|nr:hypothetical protein [Mariprofundaceae bacterium]
MRIACPHCQAIYEVASSQTDVSFVCSRCHHEFRIGESTGEDASPEEQKAPQAADIQLGLFEGGRSDKEAKGGLRYQPAADSPAKPPLFLERLATTDTLSPATTRARKRLAEGDGAQASRRAPPARAPQKPEKPEKPVATAKDDAAPEPERRAPRLLSWMSGIMMLVAVAGFAFNHESWQENIWMRSILLNLHLPIRVHSSDWRIPPDSVHAEWLKRDDGSAVLVIEGRIDNLLHAELATPWIEVTVFDAFHSDKTVKRKTFPVTLPPAIDAIRHAPWKAPPQDNVPVAAAGGRGFILVMDDLPEHAGEFTLDVVPSLFR